MFINRLTDAQLVDFAKDLLQSLAEIPQNQWSIHIKRLTQDVVRLSLLVHNNPQYDFSANLFDFGLSIFDSGLLLESFITKKFLMFMYHTFGEEYKEAYMKNSEKIFEEDNDN